LTVTDRWLILLAAALMLGMAGCAGAPLPMAEPLPAPEAAPAPVTSDQVLLEEAVKGRALAPPEVAGLSDRLLAEGNPSLRDDRTMARLEILLLKTLKAEDRGTRAVLWRNLGIIHYYQKKYPRASQELRQSNEVNPRDARTHFYLARLCAHQGEIFQQKEDQLKSQGQVKAAAVQRRKSKGQFKQAQTEMDLARKLAPNNPQYRQDLKQLLQQEQGR
jgi:tetratricopeptide (TPR) repeat protein